MILHWHAESGSLWYSSTFDPGDGLVEDVTGIEWAENMAKSEGIMPTELDNKMRANPVAKIADELAHHLWAKGYGRNCVNCDHWRKEEQLCSYYKSLPPAEVIVIGCQDHTDLIPF